MIHLNFFILILGRWLEFRTPSPPVNTPLPTTDDKCNAYGEYKLKPRKKKKINKNRLTGEMMCQSLPVKTLPPHRDKVVCI